MAEGHFSAGWVPQLRMDLWSTVANFRLPLYCCRCRTPRIRLNKRLVDLPSEFAVASTSTSLQCAEPLRLFLVSS